METRCKECDCPMMAERAWRALPKHRRAELRLSVGTRPLAGRGVCDRCYRALTNAGALIDYERASVPLEMVAAEWPRLYDPEISQAANIRVNAPRLGMTEAALEQAIVRMNRQTRRRVAA